MANPVRLSIADQVMINALAWVSVNIHPEDPNVRMWMGVVREVLPSVSMQIPAMRQLAQSVQVLLRDDVDGLERERARLRLRDGLMALFMARAGQALEQFREGKQTCP